MDLLPWNDAAVGEVIMSTPKVAPLPTQPPQFSEEIRKMEYEPLDTVELKLIWYTFFSGIGLLVVLVWISKTFIR